MPRWWTPLWAVVVLDIIALGVVGYFLLHATLGNVVLTVALTLLFMGIAGYIRRRPSMSVGRVVYILLGITLIGFALFIAYALTIGRHVTNYLGAGPSFVIAFTVPYIIGAFIGDWIGRRRDYRLWGANPSLGIPGHLRAEL